MNPYFAFVLYLFAILSVVASMLVLNHFLGPKPAATKVKLEAFECGATPVDPRNVRPVAVKYYGIAIAFVLFDLETVFLVLWVLAARPLTDFMVVTFALFTVLLVLILLYIYKARLLEAVTE
jgi:NADH-quinone oxidoreductase subunit A